MISKFVLSAQRQRRPSASRLLATALLTSTAMAIAAPALGQSVYNGNHAINGNVFLGTEITVGDGTVGTLDISGIGSHANNGDFYIGRNPGGDGLVTIVSGPGYADSSGDLYIGADGGTGSLRLAEGGRFNVGDGAGSIYIANTLGSTGLLYIGTNPTTSTIEAGGIVFGLGSGVVEFDHGAAPYAFSTGFSGNGVIRHSAGVTRLTGGSSGFTGLMEVNGGTMLVDADMGSGDVEVASGATFGGSGATTGIVTLQDGAILAPGGVGASGTLALGGLVMASGSIFDVDLGAPGIVGGTNDLVDITGDLTLDGTLNITDAGAFGGGLYRLMNYGGTLTNLGLEIGTVPSGFTASDLAIEADSGQVNLLNSAGLTLSFWDGDAPASSENDAVDGGSGVWTATSATWTNTFGDANGALETPPGLAIFSGAAGTVTVDASAGAVGAQGYQFFVDGYRIEGDDLTLTEAATAIRVGDGTAAGADVEAVLAAGLAGAGGLEKTDYGVLVLSGENTYAGATLVSAGTLALQGGSAVADGGSVTIANVAGAVLRIDESERVGSLSGGGAAGGGVSIAGGQVLTTGAAADSTFSGVISGAGGLTKAGAGVFTLAGANTYAGNTIVADGTLRAGAAGAFSGSSAFDVDGVLDLNGFNQSVAALSGAGVVTNDAGAGTGRLIIGAGGASSTFDGELLDGAGGILALTKTGSGTLTLAGDNAYTGTTIINGGALSVMGSLTGSNVSVTNAVLTGSGTIAGVVTLNSGGILAPGEGVGGMTIGELLMTANGRLSFDLGAPDEPGASDLLTVTGDVSLRGRVNVTDAGDFGAGVYRLINYGGSLLADSMTVGSVPGGVNAADLSLQTSIDGQVNLVNTTGLDLLFWDGDDPASANNGQVDGGGGVWNQEGTAWTDANGIANGAMRPYPGFAVFQGTAGTVTVQGTELYFPGSGIFEPVTTAGMQFAVDGYVINGDALQFSGAQTIFRVGDGSLASAGYTAAINSVLGGSGGLVKTDLGTLVLGAANAYSGGTILRGGVLRLLQGSGMGGGVVTAEGGALDYATGISVANLVTLDADLAINQSGGAATHSGVISGAFGLVKTGDGGLTLTGANTFTGGAQVAGGVLTLQGGAAVADTSAVTVDAGAELALGADETIGSLAGAGAVDVDGFRLTIGGDGADTTFAGQISGSGGLAKIGDGDLVLSGDGDWTGLTTVHGGTLVIEGDNNQGTGSYAVGLADGDNGALIIRDSGTLASGLITLGSASGATGVATVSGSASLWANSGGLIVGDAGGGALQVLDSGVFTTNSLAFIGNQAGSTGAVTVSGPGSQFTSSTQVYVGYQGDGALEIAAGGQVADAIGFIGVDGGSTGRATVTGAGSVWVNSDTVHVGYFGSGALAIGDGGIVRVDGGTGVAHVGFNTGSAGVLAIGAAAGDAAAAAGTLEAAEVRFGAGSSTLIFNHTDGDYLFTPLITGTGGVSHYAGTTILTADNTWNGLTAIHGGSLVIEGASNQAVGAYHVGQLADDDGALILRAGGTIESGNVTIGTDTGANGAVTVTGATSAWDASSGNFRVGEDGVGVLTIADGGSVSSFYGTVGLRAGGSGEATVTGSGSVWTVTSEFGVGGAGEGSLLISDGGSIIAGQGVIGGLAGAAGDVTVTGAGSSWSTSGTLYVAHQGQGDLIVAEGAAVTNNAGYLGSQAGSSGSARVTGGGSLWNNSVLYVGASGAGALQIADGGVVRAGAGAGVVHVGQSAAGAGVLSIGAAAGEAALAAGVLEAGELRFGAGTGSLVFNHAETDYDFDVLITGAGQIDVLEGLTTLTRDNATFTGSTTVAGGDLRVADTLGGQVTVSTGSLGGSGSVLGAVSIGAGSLVGEAGSVFTMGSLSLNSASVLDVSLGAPATDALFDVAGDLTLDGTLDITDAGAFGAGIYGLITYGGALTDNGLLMGDLPVGYSAGRFQVQTSVAGQVNLVNAGMADLLFWDGGDASLHNNDAIDGGSGTWTYASPTWTDVDGAANGAMMPVPGLAVFMGAGGTVTLDDSAGSLSATGLQFAADGYTLTGDDLALVEETPGSGVNLRVGDATAAGADWTAIVDSDLSGATSVAKTDLGTLILTGVNSWTGATSVHNGVLVFEGGSHTGATYTVGRVNGDDGALIIRGGGSVANLDSFIGQAANSAGATTVTGPGSQWASTNQLSVGLNGDGVLTIADGGVVNSGWAAVGSNTGSNGVATVAGAGSRWTGSSGLSVGREGTGALTIADGGEVDVAGEVYFGNLAGGSGVGTVTGAGSRLSTVQGLFVGSDGSGVLNILDGGVVESGTPWASIGANASGQGVATVSGTGSLWTTAGQLHVGAYGAGELNVLDGAAVNVDGTVLYVGTNASAVGEATVSGDGSALTFNQLQIGSRGQGSMGVEAGAGASGVDAYIGAFANGAGDLAVTGADSRLGLSGDLVIGAWGDGGALLADGGLVTVDGDVVIARELGATGVLIIGAAAGDAAVGAGVLDADTLVFGAGTGSLVFNHTGTNHDFASDMSGSGQISVLSGQTVLSGDSSAFTGTTTVNGGDLRLDGVLGGDVGVDGGSLGGSGSVLGAVAIADGGMLSGVQGQTLGLGALTLLEGSTVAVALGAAGDMALFDVAGDLTLDGELEVSDAGGFGAGIYRLFDYGGALTDLGLDIGAVPAGVSVGDLLVQTSVDNQVNLVSTYEVELRFWDGPGPVDDGAIQGGDGTWLLGGRGWTGADGIVNGAYDNPAFAVFMGTGGTVTVAGAGIGVTGMQFAVDGYEITGGGIALTEAETIVRVGDGTAAGADMTATITSNLTGAGGLVKADLGTLVLTGVNSYGGGTVVQGGTLIGDAGSIAGDLVNNALTIFDQAIDGSFSGEISGTGLLIKDGAAALTLTGTGSYTGGLQVREGVLIGDTGSIVGDVANDATLVFDQGSNGIFSGVISGGGSLIKDGAGALTLTGPSVQDWSVAGGTLNVGSAAFSGDVSIGSGATFRFAAAVDRTWAGTLAGTGAFAAAGEGTLTLTGDSSGFSGETSLTGDGLQVDGVLGGDVTVSGGELGGSGSVLGAVSVEGGSLLGVQGQTLSMGALTLSAASSVEVILGAGPSDSLFDVAGGLTLDGVLNVTDLGGFGAGVYGLFTYGGDLTDLGLAVGDTPAGVSEGDLLVQTATAGQVNLINTAGVELRFWDGAGPADDGAIQGGDGTWSLTGRGWTGADGAVNGAYDNPAFAVFMGTGGGVDVDGAGIGVTGMQFAVDGYSITGDGVDLTEAETIVRVGDGTAAGAGMTATIASSLTGAGGLVKTDLGTLILTGTNSYEGGTFVQAGTLIGDADSIAGEVVNDAVLVFDQGADAAFAGTISGDGEAFKRGAGVLTLLGGSAMDWSVETGGLLAQAGAFSGDVDLASGANFILNADENAAWSGALSGEGTFTKTGAGGLALNGDSSDFEGVTEISEGLLVLNGLLGGELRILEGAMLAGSGALAELTAGDGAVIAPGNSIGTLTITGDVVFEAGSIYEVEVDPASDASDRIVAGGTATLNGGVVRHIGLIGDYRPEATYTILTAAGGVTGAFDAIETDFAFLDASLDYEADAVLMLLERNAVPFPAVGETFNQRSTGAAVEATQPGDPLYDAVVGQNADGARLAFDMLSGELHGSIRSAQSEAAQVLAGTLTGRMDAARSIADGAAFWAQAAGSRTRLSTDGNAASLTHGSTGLMMGADAGFGAVRLGVAGGASAHDYDSHARAGSAEGDSLSLAAYGSGQWGALGLKGAVSATWHEVQTERLAAFPGFAEVLTADYDAETVHAFVEASWRVDMGPAATLEPFVNIARVRTESDAFSETGGDAALAVQGRVQAANLATAGVGMSRAFDQGDGRTAVLSGRLGWRHAWDDTAGDGRHAFAGSPTPAGAFTVRGLPVAEDALVAELGLDLDLKDRLSLSVDWSGQLASDLNANALAATLNWRF